MCLYGRYHLVSDRVMEQESGGTLCEVPDAEQVMEPDGDLVEVTAG